MKRLIAASALAISVSVIPVSTQAAEPAKAGWDCNAPHIYQDIGAGHQYCRTSPHADYYWFCVHLVDPPRSKEKCGEIEEPHIGDASVVTWNNDIWTASYGYPDEVYH